MKRKEKTLKDLMDLAFDEMWFHVVDGDAAHFFWTAAYIGGPEETMAELRPLLPRTFGEEFTLEVKVDPEDRRKRVPMVRVDLDEESRTRLNRR